MYRVIELLTDDEIFRCHEFAAGKSNDSAIRLSGRPAANSEVGALDPAAHLILGAINRNIELFEFAFPVQTAPPLITWYRTGAGSGEPLVSAFVDVPGGTFRSDLACTIFLDEPRSYEGGALRLELGDVSVRLKLGSGQAALYPAGLLREVEPVTRGESCLASTVIQSRVPDAFQRSLLFELNEVAALEGNQMARENFSRLQLVQSNLLRYWSRP